MNRLAVIQQLKETQLVLAKLLDLLEASEQDKFAAHLYQARRQFRHISERPGKQQGDGAKRSLNLPDRAKPGL
jgi:hypothetical protein